VVLSGVVDLDTAPVEDVTKNSNFAIVSESFSTVKSKVISLSPVVALIFLKTGWGALTVTFAAFLVVLSFPSSFFVVMERS